MPRWMLPLARELLFHQGQMRSDQSTALSRTPRTLGWIGALAVLGLAGTSLLQEHPRDLKAWEYGASPASLPSVRSLHSGFWHHPEERLDLSYPEIVSLLRRRMPRRTRQETIQALAAQTLRLCRELGFQPSFVLAVIEHESAFRPRARSAKDAQGLMQLRPSTAADVARSIGYRGTRAGWIDLRDPVLNVTLGLHYLAQLRSRFGSEEGTLAAYNLGPARWAELQARPQKLKPGGDTAKYVALIQRTSTQLKIEGQSAWKPRLADRRRKGTAASALLF